MGDRGNVYIKQAEVYLYTHWGGSELPHTVQGALKRGRDRWTDDSYLARIVFNEMTAGSETETAGYGICHRMVDNEHLIIVLDCETQRIGFAPEPAYPTATHPADVRVPGKNVMSWPFETFCKMTAAAVERAWRKAENQEPEPEEERKCCR